MRSESKRVFSDLHQLRDIQKLLPGNPAISTIVRWGRRGLLAPNGERTKLPMRKVGGKLFVSESDLLAWLESVDGQDSLEQTAKPHLDRDALDRMLDAEKL